MNVKLDKLVKIDSREKSRIKPATKHFSNHKIVKLDTGDFVYDDKVVIEYKTASDFISSIIDKRIFRQVTDMIRDYDYPYIMVEGNVVEEIVKLQMNKAIDVHFTVDQYNGSYTSLMQVIRIVHCNNFKHGLHLMSLLFKKSTDGKCRIYNYKLKESVNPCVNYLSNIKGIGLLKSELICEELHLNNLLDLLCLNPDDLLNVSGVGPKTKDIIMKACGV